MRLQQIFAGIISFLIYSNAYAVILYSPPVIKKEGWHISLQALYAQSIFNTQIATTETSPELIPHIWSVGYKTQLTYLFENNLDVNVNWLYFNTNINQTIQSSDNLNGQYTVNHFGSGIEEMADNDISQINQVVTDIQNKINTINFEFGRSSKLNSRLNMRYQIGLQYADIHQNITQTASNMSINSTYNYNDAQLNTKYNGIGPRAGFDLNYKLAYGFSIVNGFSAALPTGPATITETSHQSNETNTGIGNVGTVSFQEIRTIFDYSNAISLRYQYAIMDSLWFFDTGYQVTDYDIAEQSGFFLSLRMTH